MSVVKFWTINIKVTAMEMENSITGINVSPYKISLAKRMEENKRSLENYHKLQTRQNKVEQKKQESDCFVCDWQQSYDHIR